VAGYTPGLTPSTDWSPSLPAAATLLIANPKEIIRAGLRALLAKAPVRIVGEATNATNTVSLVKQHKPSVLLMGAAMPSERDCFSLLSKIGKAVPNTRVILLSAVDSPTYMARAKAAGAADFLLESVTGKELGTAIENAAAGKMPKGSGAFARVSASMANRPQSIASDSKLTPREAQVLSHIAYGLANLEIAKSLEISVETVKEHVQNVLRKLGVSDRTQAAVWAVKAKLD
jgi:DNA-binding NarL/FixJ family response regulator